MAGIIKAEGRTDSRAGGALRSFQFEDVGQAYLREVRAEAENIIAAAKREAAQIKTKAAEEGRQAALQAVEASLRTRLAQQLANGLAAVQQAAQEIAHARHAWQQHWERNLVGLATAIAARLCRRELARSPEITLAWVREALHLAAGSGQVAVRLHPDDHAALAGQIDAISKAMSALGTVRVVPDPAISAGGCRVETEFGSLDQQMEAQLARIIEEMLG